MSGFNYNFSGRLAYNEYAQYELHNKDKDMVNLSHILARIYYSNEQYILTIKIYCRGKLMFSAEGYMTNEMNSCGFESYHVEGLDIDGKLFELVGEDIDVVLHGEAGSYGT